MANMKKANDNKTKRYDPKRNRETKASLEGRKVAANAGSFHKNDAIANIVSTSTSIAVRNIAGNKIPIPTVNSTSGVLTVLPGDFTVPGVFGIRYAPVFGIARGSQTDPVNLAARNLWVNLRSLYSNKIPYTAGAIMMYSMALDGILTCMNWLKRAYGIVFAFDARNRYVCDGLLWDMGIDPNDFRQNLPEVKTFVNKVCAEMSAFGVPSAFKFVFDHMDATSHIYVDDAAVNAQYLIMTPEFVWHMDWANNKLYADYSIIGQPGVQAQWSQIATNLTNLIEDFVNNEDCYMIAGDIRRVFGDVNVVGPLNSDFAIGPEYSTDILQILHNMTWPLDRFNKLTVPWEITELQAPTNVGAISASYCTGFEVLSTQTEIPSWVHAVTPGIYDFDGNEPDQGMFLQASNWKYAITAVSHAANSYKIRIETCGTLLATSMDYLTMKDMSTDPNRREYATHSLALKSDANGDIYLHDVHSPLDPAVSADFAIQTWNWHPMVPSGHVVRTASNNVVSVSYTPSKFVGQFDQYVTIDVEELRRIHEAIILDRVDATGVGTLNMK